MLQTDKFLVKLRTNTSLSFNTSTVTTNNTSNEIIKANRVLTIDLTASYLITKNIGVGPYYMYNYGVEKNAIKNALDKYGTKTEDKKVVALKLGIGIATLYRKIEEYELSKW